MRFPTYPPVPLRLRESITRIPEEDRPFVALKFGGVPRGYFEAMLSRYLELHQLKGRRDANLFCHDVEDMFPPHGVGLLIEDDELIRHAEACARQVRQMIGAIATTSETAVRMRLEGIARRHGIRMPVVRTLASVVQRMTREHWWRRQLRRRLCEVEHGAIRAGLVHLRAAPYVSDEAFKRFKLQRERLQKTLEDTEAVNQTTGDVVALADLIEHSVSNPKVRRAEMMTRLRGMERYATAAGLIGVFYTITCPSRMHARWFVSGAANPKYDGGAPRDSQRYLVKLWAKIRATLARKRVQYFGLRVTEPHHDATPHWHMLIFVRRESEPALTETMRSCAMETDGDEAGADKHRFVVERIDPARGGAVAYVAKYVAKNIDGEHVGIDLETGAPATRIAQRVEAWARLWRIRQFQFFGTPSVVPWRELRRLRMLPDSARDDWAALWAAADAGEWCEYMQLIHERALRVSPVMELRESSNYPGELIERVRGVRLAQAERECELRTRDGEWTIRWGGKIASVQKWGPWTRDNNCTGEGNQGLAAICKTDFPVLSRKPAGGPGFSLAILDGNLSVVEGMKPSPEREDRANFTEVVNEVRTAAGVLPRAERRNEHASRPTAGDAHRPGRQDARMVEPDEKAIRHPGPARALLPPQPGRQHGRSAGAAHGGAPLHAQGTFASVGNRRMSGPPQPRHATRHGLDEDGCGEE